MLAKIFIEIFIFNVTKSEVSYNSFGFFSSIKDSIVMMAIHNLISNESKTKLRFYILSKIKPNYFKR